VQTQSTSQFNFVLATFLSLLASNLFIYSNITYLADSSAPDWITGLFYYSCFAPFLLAFSWIGRLTDRANKKRVLVLALTGIAVAMGVQMLLAHLYTSFFVYVGIGILFGFFFLFIPSFRFALISDCFPKPLQGRVLILANSCAVLAMTTAPLLQSVLRQFQYGDTALLIAIILTLIAAFIYSRSKVVNISSVSDFSRRDPLPQQTFYLLAYCALAISLLGPLQTMLPKLLVSRFHFSMIERDLFMPLLGLGVVLSIPLTKVLQRIRYIQNYFLGLALSAMCLFIGLAGTLLEIGVAIVLSAMLAGTIINLLQLQLQASVAHHQQGQLMARMAMVSLGIPSIAAGLVGIISSRIGISATFMVLSAMLAFGFIALELFRWRRELSETMGKVSDEI